MLGGAVPVLPRSIGLPRGGEEAPRGHQSPDDVPVRELHMASERPDCEVLVVSDFLNRTGRQRHRQPVLISAVGTSGDTPGDVYAFHQVIDLQGFECVDDRLERGALRLPPAIVDLGRIVFDERGLSGDSENCPPGDIEN